MLQSNQFRLQSSQLNLQFNQFRLQPSKFSLESSQFSMAGPALESDGDPYMPQWGTRSYLGQQMQSSIKKSSLLFEHDNSLQRVVDIQCCMC